MENVANYNVAISFFHFVFLLREEEVGTRFAFGFRPIRLVLLLSTFVPSPRGKFSQAHSTISDVVSELVDTQHERASAVSTMSYIKSSLSLSPPTIKSKSYYILPLRRTHHKHTCCSADSISGNTFLSKNRHRSRVSSHPPREFTCHLQLDVRSGQMLKCFMLCARLCSAAIITSPICITWGAYTSSRSSPHDGSKRDIEMPSMSCSLRRGDEGENNG